MSFKRISQRFASYMKRMYVSSQLHTAESQRKLLAAGLCTICGAVFTRKYIIDFKVPIVPRIVYAREEVSAEDSEEDSSIVIRDVYQHARERRFHQFASVQVDGELYMTPRDFLESVTDEEPRPRSGVIKLDNPDLKSFLRKTPDRSVSSSKLFRFIHDNGIISYTEYLFLLCILTKPRAGFKIAFKMFDTDGNERVDKQEFLVLEEIFRKRAEKKIKEGADMSTADAGRLSLAEVKMVMAKKDEEVHDTTLLVHFFGMKGNQTLSYEDFFIFMDNLQTEVLELEFLAYSHGMPTISEEDFARILLRFTEILDESEYIDKLKARMPDENGITFEEFRSFFQFLNNLEDFAISVKLYAIAGKALGEDEFHRAVKVSTDVDLSSHLVHTLYQIFDKDGDGKLSYVEFIGVMKDRLHRGFRSHLIKHSGWIGFKKCMKQTIKAMDATA